MRRQVVIGEKAEETKSWKAVKDCSGTGTMQGWQRDKAVHPNSRTRMETRLQPQVEAGGKAGD